MKPYKQSLTRLVIFIIGDADDNMYRNMYYIEDTINRMSLKSFHSFYIYAGEDLQNNTSRML